MKFSPDIKSRFIFTTVFALCAAPVCFAQKPAPTSSPSLGNAAFMKEAESLQPSNQKPFKIAKDDYAARQKWKKVVAKYIHLPADQVTAHPSATDFPGAVSKNAPRVKRSFDVALNLPRWHSTGLYAPPGKVVTVHVSPKDAKLGLKIVIGAHTDNIMRSTKWKRFPEISRKFTITQPETKVANAFGGLIYIDVPRNPALGGYHFRTYGGYGWLDENRSAVPDHANVTIDGAVEAPYFVLGKTTAAEWAKSRQSPAPWGELATKRVILTLPSSLLRTLNDPAPLMKLWNRYVNAEASLAGWKEQPAPPMRLVADRQISAGFMHSGYPIMYHLPSAKKAVDLATLTTKGNWGFFHEMGHNHEGQAYTFGGDYVEVVVNLYSMYVMDKIVGVGLSAHGMSHLDKLLSERLGPEHKTGPWQNLAMYALPIKALGWAPLRKTLATYSKPDGTKGIKTREQKMDQWVLRYSEAAGKNLAPYFAAFGVTCSEQTKQKLKSLPAWLPSPNFPKEYTHPQKSEESSKPKTS